MDYKKILLKKGKEASTLRRHHWIFSGAIQEVSDELKDGDLVHVFNQQKEVIATGYYNEGSIAVKVLDFGKTEINAAYFEKIVTGAFMMRQKAGLTELSTTNAYRLIHGEGDGLPGIIVDNYNGHIVIQLHHSFVVPYIDLLVSSIQKIVPGVVSIYIKSTGKFETEVPAFYLGQDEETIIKENGIQLYVNWVKGQKTGFFLDQRENRLLAGRYSEGKKILNTFCYTGAFSMYAMKNGAAQVDSVDSSIFALEGLEKNIQMNGFDSIPHNNINADALEYLSDMGGEYDMIILDPPAFAKSLSAKHRAIMAYKRINSIAINKIKKGGILFTYSCSQVVDKYTFTNTVVSAAIENKKNVKILHSLSQPADHPVNIFHPETEYLKGLVLFVE